MVRGVWEGEGSMGGEGRVWGEGEGSVGRESRGVEGSVRGG